MNDQSVQRESRTVEITDAELPEFLKRVEENQDAIKEVTVLQDEKLTKVEVEPKLD